MAKFPSQRKLLYESGAISQGGFTSVGHVNLPKDLSILNRRGYASTTRKGVPLVYKAKIDFYGQDDAGAGASGDLMKSLDFQGTLRINGCQNNWVMRNAAVKWHAALQAMRAKAGIRKSDVGAYAHEIRYGYDAANDTFATPIDGDGNAFTGGTWDYTRFASSQDSSFGLKLVGLGVDEDTAAGVTAVQIGHSYLSSRRQPDADSNQGVEETPAEFSHLQQILADDVAARQDEITTFTRDDGDNVPYEPMATETVNHDITEPVQLGKIVLSQGNLHGSCIVEVPFGLMDLHARMYDESTGTTDTPIVTVGVEVLDIFEMEG